MYTPLSAAVYVFLVFAMTSVLSAQDADHAFQGGGPDMTGVWETVFEDGETMSFELLQRGDSLYGYTGSGMPIHGTWSTTGELTLVSVESIQITLSTWDPANQVTMTVDSGAVITTIRRDTTVEVTEEYRGRVEPYATSVVDRYITSFKGTMSMTSTDTGETLLERRFSAAKRFDTELPSWMRPKVQTLHEWTIPEK